ncbi:MAG TPA: GNAT family N-acetyltransferase [Acidobacteriaceae bacterium]|jgi:ribosomal protein S18 acetylase RimI-like enzyme|nr:GNAT family N-acetyltransferase [Acidobacteriaceae bacterium]
MTPAVQLEILDLRHFSAGNLKPVLEAEGRVWSERLRWDFSASAGLLLQYLDSHVLPGYVALENGRIRGYIFCVYEGDKAVVGDVFAIPATGGGESAEEIERSLIEHLIELLRNSPGIERIESQLLLHPHGSHTEPLLRAGFQVYERLFMELDLTQPALEAPLHEAPAGLELRPWHDADFSPAGYLISEAYQGHLDSLINDQYRSVAGSLRFLHNIVRFPGCGFFDPAASSVLSAGRRDEIAGLLLCSRVREDVGHVTQICVAQRYRRRGFGAQLLARSIAELKRRHFRSLSLTVTAENHNAIELYRRLGFVTQHRFDAMVWDQRAKG